MENISKNVKEFKLCGYGSCGCPKVIIKEKEVIIIDDYGGRVQLTINEFKLLKDIFDKIF